MVSLKLTWPPQGPQGQGKTTFGTNSGSSKGWSSAKLESFWILKLSDSSVKKDGEITPPLKPPSHDVGLKLCDVVVALPTSSWFRSHLVAHLKMHPCFDSNWFQNLAEKLLGQQIDSATTFNDAKNIRSKKPHLLSPHWKHWYAVEWLISIAANVSPQKYLIIVQQCTKEWETLHSFDGHDRAWLFPQHLKTWY